METQRGQLPGVGAALRDRGGEQIAVGDRDQREGRAETGAADGQAAATEAHDAAPVTAARICRTSREPDRSRAPPATTRARPVRPVRRNPPGSASTDRAPPGRSGSARLVATAIQGRRRSVRHVSASAGRTVLAINKIAGGCCAAPAAISQSAPATCQCALGKEFLARLSPTRGNLTISTR